MNALNLGLRFLLELAALGAMGVWGWSAATGVLRYGLAIGLPLLAAVAWGTFAVPDDPSRGGTPVVVVPGAVRLVLELAFFGAAAWALRDLGRPQLGLGFAIVVALHYAVAYPRIAWLLQR